MGDGIYLGMAGASAREQQLDAIADNLANAQTPGFKATRPAFESFVTSADAAGLAAPAAVSPGVDLRPGMRIKTGNPLDVTPDGEAFFAVKVGDQVAYTRNGRMAINAEGGLEIAGHSVLGKSGQPIAVPLGAKVEITPKGAVTANGQPIDELGLYQFAATPERIGPSLMGPGQGPAPVPVDAAVASGELEQGNFNPIEAAVQLVNAQRNFETSIKAIETYKAMGDRANQLGSVP